MTELPQLTRPVVFLLAGAGAVFIFLHTLRAQNETFTRSLLHGLLRCVLLLSICFYLSVPYYSAVRERSVVRNVLIDTSHSIEAPRWKRLVTSVTGAIKQQDHDTPTKVFLFAGRYRHMLSYRNQNGSTDPDALTRKAQTGVDGPFRNGLEPHRTRIVPAANDLLTSVTGNSWVENIVLTDGHANPPADLGTLPRTSSAQTVFVPIRASRRYPVVLRRINAPRRIRSGEPFQLRLTVRSAPDMNATLSIWIDGIKQDPIDLTLRANRTRRITAGPFNPFSEQDVRKKKLIRVRARLQPEDDDLPTHTARTGMILLPPLRVLSLSDRDEPGPVTRAVRAQGQTVDPTSASSVTSENLSTADLLLMTPPLPDFSDAVAQHIRTFVRRDGGGLLIVSGTGNDARKQLTSTPLRDLFPVRPIEPAPEQAPDVTASAHDENPSPEPEPDPNPERDRPDENDTDQNPSPSEPPDRPDDEPEGSVEKGKVSTVSLMLVVDKSGSMTGKKIGLVKEAAIAALDTLDDEDRIGVIAFDHRPRLVTEPINASRKSLYKRRIARLYASGGTNSYRALQAAERLLKREKAGLKHVLLLSDGKTSPADFQSLIKSFRKQNITVSTVAAGQNADTRLMTRIARWGNGNFHETSSFKNIPQIFTTETRALVKASEKPPDPTDERTSSDRPDETLPRSARAGTTNESDSDTADSSDPESGSDPEDPDPPSDRSDSEPADASADDQKQASEDRPPRKPVRKREPVPLLHGFSSEDMPPVRRYLRSRRRSLALLPLVVKIPSGKEFPFLSYGYAGSGTVGMFLTGFNQTDAPEWTSWSAFPQLIGQTVRSMSRAQNWDALHPTFRVQQNAGNERTSIRINIPEETHNIREVAGHRLSWRSPAGDDTWHQVPLTERGTGRYRTSIVPPSPGAYLEFRLTSTLRDGRSFAYFHVVSSSVPPEFRVQDVHRDFFQTARKLGHRVLPGPESAFRRLKTRPAPVHRTTVPFPAWPMAVLALAIVLEVYLTTRTS